MGIDIVDLRRRDAGAIDRRPHAAQGAIAVLGGRGDVMSIAREPITDEFGVDLGSAALGVLVRFEHHEARALTHDEAVPIAVIRARGSFRRIVE